MGERDERAGPSLEGGLVTFVEGLEYSRRPCAGVLSVAGFSVLLEGFPGWEGFILEGRKGLPCATGPSFS